MTEIKQIPIDEVKDLIDSNRAVLIDVREQEEYDSGRIPGAKLHPLSAFSSQAVCDDCEDKPIIFHCLAGKRADMACAKFMAETGKNACCMEGSYKEWEERGFPIET